MRDAIDDCKWIDLRSIEEPRDGSPRLIIDEAKADGPPEDLEIVGKLVSRSRSIELDSTCRTFELLRPSYVAYSVRDESFRVLDEGEVWEGRLLCRYQKSHFLDCESRVKQAPPGSFRGGGQTWFLVSRVRNQKPGLTPPVP